MAMVMADVPCTHIALRFVERAEAGCPEWQLTKGMMQRSLYFLGGGRLYYRWGDHGPWSGELQQALHDLVATGRIMVLRQAAGEPSVIRYAEKRPKPRIPRDVDRHVSRALGFAAGMAPEELGLLASVHYMAMREGRRDAGRLHEVLWDALPDSPPSLGGVEWSLRRLESGGMFRAVDGIGDV